MEMQSKCVVTGVRRLDFQGEGGGSKISMTQVYVEERFSAESKDGLGATSVPYTYGDASKFAEFKDVVFPAQAEVTMVTVTTGNKQKTEMRSVKIVGQAPKRAAVV